MRRSTGRMREDIAVLAKEISEMQPHDGEAMRNALIEMVGILSDLNDTVCSNAIAASYR